jgi:hypothetical protein
MNTITNDADRMLAELLRDAVYLTDTQRVGWEGDSTDPGWQFPKTNSVQSFDFTHSPLKGDYRAKSWAIKRWSEHPQRRTETEQGYWDRHRPLHQKWRNPRWGRAGHTPAVLNVLNANEVQELIAAGVRTDRRQSSGSFLAQSRDLSSHAGSLVEDLLYALPGGDFMVADSALHARRQSIFANGTRTALGLTALAEARMKATRLDVPRHLEKHRTALLCELDKLLKDAPPEVRFADLA